MLRAGWDLPAPIFTIVVAGWIWKRVTRARRSWPLGGAGGTQPIPELRLA